MKQELLKWIDENKVGRPSVFGLGTVETVYKDDLIEKINQFDEPQKISWRKAISVLEHHFQCEIPRNLDQVIEGFNSMSGLMNSVEFELDKQGSKLTSKEFVLEALGRYKQKVKVPSFVAEWIREHCYMGKYVCLERFMCQYNNVELPTELYNYYDNNKNGARDKVISAILDDYEVEEERKYYVQLPFEEWNNDSAELETKTIFLAYDITSDETRFVYSKDGRSDFKTKLDEETIKSIDERYWQFAVPVEKV